MLTLLVQPWRKMRVQTQLILLLVFAAVVAQVINVSTQLRIRDNMLNQQRIDVSFERITTAADFMSRLPADQRQTYLSSLNLGRERYVLASEPFVERQYTQPEQAQELRVALDGLPHRPDEIRLFVGAVANLAMCKGQGGLPDILVPPLGHYTQSSHPCYSEVIASIELPHIGWLNLSLNLYGASPTSQWYYWFTDLLTLLVSIGVIIYASRSLLRPIRRLQRAVQRSGHNLTPTLVEEQGAADIRELIKEYNQMQLRISRFVTNRTQLLAAISHDLRTPITSMRLRLDFLPDSDDKTKLIENLDTLKATADDSLNFVRETNSDEDFVALDLHALVDACCDDLAETGLPVEHIELADPPSKAVIKGQQHALKRALDNLIQNAINYGQQAQVSITETRSSYRINVLDNGAGIPPDQYERVLEPFVRLESSRNSNTGGSGLGLAIVRSITDDHAGQLHFSHSEEGFMVTIELPKKIG
ncbi:HAMP domain-containing protein [Neiella marina]|uniref:histidine kinase n=1 Tax=Neiella holothuriorum TaxID=2870530 RepID=A0ABS7EC22_9GAMM|nr:ATP-binding protein [Neiella holothuriorum]MBW8189841.1 HAMP domain-containing protein [Neiella holothuriorum]